MKTTKKHVLIPWEKYLRLKKTSCENKNSSKEHIHQDNIESNNINEKESNILSAKDIVSQLPNLLQSQATDLLKVLEETTDLTWNEQGELILNNGDIVRGSNIVKLVQDGVMANNQNKPIGMTEFYKSLHGLPDKLIINRRRRHLLEQSNEHRTIPPPGKSHSFKTRELRFSKTKLKKDKANAWKGMWKAL